MNSQFGPPMLEGGLADFGDSLTISVTPQTKGLWAGIARMGGVGDNLVAASVLRPLKTMGFKNEVITQKPYSCVFENNPFIDKLSAHDPDDFPQGGGLDWQMYFAKRAKEYSVFAHLSHSMEHLIAFFPAQTAFWWPQEFRRKLANRSYIEAVHDILGVPHEFGPLFFPTNEEHDDAAQAKAQVGERVIGYCISGTRIDKLYPYAAMLVARIIKELDCSVVLFGAPNEKDLSSATAIFEHVNRSNGSTSGLLSAISPDKDKPTWPIRRILSLATHCDLMIGPDTGPMWGVAFEQLPKIAIISHASPENITKHWVNTVTLHASQQRVPCWPCHRLHDVPQTCVANKDNNGAACISDISVESIISTIPKLMKEK